MAEPDDDPRSRDAAMFAQYSRTLADAIDAALEPWVRRVVAERCAAAGVELDDASARAVDDAARQCRATVSPQVRALLSADLDDQRSTPLALLRGAVVHPTAVLASLGVPPVARDEFEVRAFTDDVYALSPASFGDLDESLHEPGLVWGAAKAHVHLTRHADRGNR